MLHIINRAAILDGAGNFAKEKYVKDQLPDFSNEQVCKLHATDMIFAHVLSMGLLKNNPNMVAALVGGKGNLNRAMLDEVLKAGDNLSENKEEAIEFATKVFQLLG